MKKHIRQQLARIVAATVFVAGANVQGALPPPPTGTQPPPPTGTQPPPPTGTQPLPPTGTQPPPPTGTQPPPPTGTQPPPPTGTQPPPLTGTQPPPPTGTQPPPPTGTQPPPPTGTQPPPPTGTQPPPPTGTQPPPPTGTQPPPPTGTQPPPSTGTQPPPPTGTQPPPPTGTQPPPPTGTQPPPPTGTQPPPPTATPPPAPAAARRAGDPLPGLTTDQLNAFRVGRGAFVRNENPNSGLGPIFNRASCVACHSRPGVGGASPIRVTRFGHTESGVFDPLVAKGGSLLQNASISPAIREVVPAEANTVAQRQTQPVFGLGLVEAIDDDTILALAQRPPSDGVAGRAAMVTDVTTGEQRVGRFGWKAQHATLLAFSADAYVNEMGITNRFFPTENAPNGNQQLLAQFDRIADPEDQVGTDGRGDIDRNADFMRFLAPLAVPATLNASATAGKQLFEQIGCVRCHEPSITTGANAVAALANKAVPLYSDLLLHDMGALGDGIAQADAGPREFRTAPLWGLRSSAPYLHDGRAPNVDAAITAHDGEGKNSRDRYVGLTAAQKRQLLDFLNAL